MNNFLSNSGEDICYYKKSKDIFSKYLTMTKSTEMYLMNKLDDWSLMNYKMVNKKIYHLCESPEFWILRIIYFFGDKYLNTVKQVIESNKHYKINYFDLYKNIRQLYCYDLQIPIENTLYNFNIYIYKQPKISWTKEKIEIASSISYKFSDEDICLMYDCGYWDIIDKLPLNSINNKTLIDVYFLGNKIQNFIKMLRLGYKPSKNAWLSLFYKWKCYYYNESRLGTILFKEELDNNLVEYQEIIKICFMNNIKPKYDCNIPYSELCTNNLLMLLECGLKLEQRIIYNHVFINKSVDVLNNFVKFANFDTFMQESRLVPELEQEIEIYYYWDLSEIEKLLKLGIQPSNNFILYNSRNKNNKYDEQLCDYFKLLVKHDISISGKCSLLKRLSRNNYFKCYDYIKSIIVHIKLPSDKHI